MDTAGRPDDRRIVTLLTVLVALLGALVLALALGGVTAWREYARMRSVVSGSGGGDGAAGVLADVSRKQKAAAGELASMTRDYTRQIAQLERRIEGLRAQTGGPIDSANRVIELTQLMADEMMLQLKLMASLDGAVEKLIRPLPVQRELLAPKDKREGAPEAR